MTNSNNFEVIIIGGSYAGLSAAMALGRSLRKVLIIDSGSPCNKQTPHSHNFITQDGETPAAIAAKAKEQVLKYPTVQLVNDLAVSGTKNENSFVISTQTGKAYTAKKLVFATGIKDTMPAIKGFAECWGISVIHCPYCHGYEFRDQPTGILSNSKKTFHLASLINNLSNNVTLITAGKPDFTAEQLAKLNTHYIEIIETTVTEIEHENGYIKNVIFADGRKKAFTALYADIPFTQHSDIPALLGCELTETGHLKVDNMQRTTTEGVYACGDNTAMMRSVANAVYGGNVTGAVVNRDLTDEQF